nr:alpha/beta fold hydrolase [Mycolicibacterium komanii]CRL67232.1 alpha/beta hydrolase [Mycolicibacterium komanii]
MVATAPRPFHAHGCEVVTVDGHRIAYREAGTGEVLLLVHGLGGSSSSWRQMMPKLATNYRVIAPDLLGHGQSDKPHCEYSPTVFARLLRGLLDTLGIAEVTVVGHSLGGGVAMMFAARHRGYCKRLVLLNSGGFGPEVTALLRTLSVPGAGIVLPLIAAGRAIWTGGPSRLRGLIPSRDDRRVFLQTLRSVVNHRGQAASALACLHALGDLPAQIIGGENDRVIPVAHAYTAHAALPGSRLTIIPGAGHDPQIQRPETVAELIDDFIAGADDTVVGSLALAA